MAPQKNIGLAVAWMSGALLGFCALALSIRGLAGALNVFEMLAIRNASGVVILLVIALFYPHLRPALRPDHMHLHLMRNGVHFAAQYVWALGLTLIPLATVFALEFTAPAWTALLGVLFLKERMTPSRGVAIVCGFLGVVIVLRPGFGTFQPIAIIVLIAAIGFALTTIATKALTRHVSAFSVVFWMNVIQLPLALMGADPWFLTKLSWPYLLPLVGIALSGLASHYCVANALRYADATIVIPMDFLRVPLIAMIGWAVYGEALDGFVFAGAGLIVLGIAWNLRVESRRR